MTMLDQMLGQVVSRINALDPVKARPVLAGEIRKRVSDIGAISYFDRYDKGAGSDNADIAAAGALVLIKTIPLVIKSEFEINDSNRQSPAVRLCLATTLAYLITPSDIVPDDAPGGYGFIDDCVLLREGYMRLLHAPPPPSASVQAEESILNLLYSCIPPQKRAELRRGAESIPLVEQFANGMSADVIEFSIGALNNNPLSFNFSSWKAAPVYNASLSNPGGLAYPGNYTPVRDNLIGMATANGIDPSFLY